MCYWSRSYSYVPIYELGRVAKRSDADDDGWLLRD